ncbi:Phage tail protein E [Vibrio aerogenes CECT 7868]|uniref:Phage tail protein E n=1 Tax=Vibrio aerogenes CECT 7868 TaxID=1216006 RepID=A0A1M6B9P7_9VIBR|nr:phage tail assembly protein [Vibrio aerogenes]SHI45484.1 Phage tail protein E [Vibrio aerogenes CECT 7868]
MTELNKAKMTEVNNAEQTNAEQTNTQSINTQSTHTQAGNTPSANTPSANTQVQFPGADKVIALDTALDNGNVTCIALRKPMPGDLRGLKLLDIIQMDAGAVAQLVPRIAMNNFTAQHFYQLDPADLLEVMTEIATFFTKDQHLTQ